MQKALPVVLLILVGLSGCAFQRAKMASRAQSELVGMSKKDLLSCAGVPPLQARVDDLEFLTYASGGDSVGTVLSRLTSPSTAVATGKRARRYCEATFILKDSVVQRVNYQGRTGGWLTKGEQCAFIIENCLKP